MVGITGCHRPVHCPNPNCDWAAVARLLVAAGAVADPDLEAPPEAPPA